MKKICFALLLAFLISALLSACDGLLPPKGDDFYFDGDIDTDTSRRPDPEAPTDGEPEAGIGENDPTDMPYLPLS